MYCATTSTLVYCSVAIARNKKRKEISWMQAGLLFQIRWRGHTCGRQMLLLQLYMLSLLLKLNLSVSLSLCVCLSLCACLPDAECVPVVPVCVPVCVIIPARQD